MNLYHYLDDQGNISDALPLTAIQKIGLPPATKVLLEGSKQWTTLEQVSHGGAVVFPVAPPKAGPASPPPISPPQLATSATPATLAGVTVASRSPQAGGTSKFYPTFFLGVFLGVFGAHRFYVRKIGTGILQLVTFGGLGVWWLVDMIMILLGKFKDKQGVLIPNVNPKLSWTVFAAVVVIGLASQGLGGDSSNSGSSNSDGTVTLDKSQSAELVKLLGAYEGPAHSERIMGAMMTGVWTVAFFEDESGALKCKCSLRSHDEEYGWNSPETTTAEVKVQAGAGSGEFNLWTQGQFSDTAPSWAISIDGISLTASNTVNTITLIDMSSYQITLQRK